MVDANTAEDIFGKEKGYLSGKTTRSNSHQVQATYINIPKQLMEKKQCVTLSADIMFINGIPFFFTDGHYINFITVLITKDQQNQGPLCKAQLLHQVNVDGQKI